VQINQRAGLTFATALRSILRSDPDVVMVGEIRDGETARISIEAALTGHLVLSTLHTNDAPGALTRLNEMGVEPFITGAAVSAVLAQRLARKLCGHCSEPYTPSRAELLALRVDPDTAAALEGAVFRRPGGCARCGNTGYRGRVGLYEVMEIADEIRELFSEDAEYRYQPWGEPIVGRDSIVGDWLEGRDAAGTYSARYSPYAVDGDQAVAVGESRYTNPDGSLRAIYHNVFLLGFDDDGLCRSFTELFMELPESRR
jgi:hypothetical protein